MKEHCLQIQRKVIFLENLERDTGMVIKNRVDYNTAMKYRENHPQPKREHAFLASLSHSTACSTAKQPNGKGKGNGSGLKPIKRSFE